MFNGVCEVFDRLIELFRNSVVGVDCLGNIPFSVMKELQFNKRGGKKVFLALKFKLTGGIFLMGLNSAGVLDLDWIILLVEIHIKSTDCWRSCKAS